MTKNIITYHNHMNLSHNSLYNPLEKNAGRKSRLVIYIAKQRADLLKPGEFAGFCGGLDCIQNQTFLRKVHRMTTGMCTTYLSCLVTSLEMNLFFHAITYNHQPANHQSLAARPLAKHLGSFVPKSAEERTAKIKANQWNQIHTRPY